MRYAILGDIHSNLEALNAVLEKASEEDVEQYVCIGDIVGYNASPRECLEIIRGLEPDVIVRGNHDDYAASDAELVGFNPQAARVVQWTREHLTKDERTWLASLPYQQNVDARTTVVHATLDMPGRWGYVFDKLSAAASFNYQFTQFCFFGHTHVPVVFNKFGSIDQGNPGEVIFEPGHKYMINVGSVGQPRDGNPQAAFGIYDTEERWLRHFRVDYDIETCQKRIRDAALPERCAQRLAVGR